MPNFVDGDDAYGSVVYDDGSSSAQSFSLNSYYVGASIDSKEFFTNPGDSLIDSAKYHIPLGGYFGNLDASLVSHLSVPYMQGSSGATLQILPPTTIPFYLKGFAPRFAQTASDTVTTTDLELDIVDGISHTWQNNNAGYTDGSSARNAANWNLLNVAQLQTPLKLAAQAYSTGNPISIQQAMLATNAAGIAPLRNVVTHNVTMANQRPGKITPAKTLQELDIEVENSYVTTYLQPSGTMNWRVFDFQIMNPVTPYTATTSGTTPPTWTAPDGSVGGSGTASACLGYGVGGALFDRTKCQNYLTWYYNNPALGYDSVYEQPAAYGNWTSALVKFNRTPVIDGALVSPTTSNVLYHSAGSTVPTLGCIGTGDNEYQCSLTQYPMSIEGKTVLPNPNATWINPQTFTFNATTTSGCNWGTSDPNGPKFANGCPKLMPTSLYSTDPVWIWKDFWAFLAQVGITRERAILLACVDAGVYYYTAGRSAYNPVLSVLGVTAVGLLGMVATTPLGSITAAWKVVYNTFGGIVTTIYDNYLIATQTKDTVMINFIDHLFGYTIITGVGLTLSILGPAFFYNSLPTSVQATAQSSVGMITVIGVFITLGIDFAYFAVNGDMFALISSSWNDFWAGESTNMCKALGSIC